MIGTSFCWTIWKEHEFEQQKAINASQQQTTINVLQQQAAIIASQQKTKIKALQQQSLIYELQQQTPNNAD